MATSTFKIYRSSDGSAPSLTGQVGALLTVLDAVLVNGYGSQTAAGWSKPFVNSGNIGCYKQGAGAGLNLSINDNGPGAGAAKEARITGYETLSAVATGTNPFPTSAQGVGSNAMVVARKSASADGTVRSWIVVADASTFYMFVLTGDNASNYLAFAFGDFYSFVNSDNWRCFIVGRAAENSSTITDDKLDVLSALNTATAGSFTVRSFGGTVAGSITQGRHGDSTKGSASALTGTVPYLNGADSGIYVSPVWVVDAATSTVRGQLRGFWHFCHAISNLTDGQTFSVTSGTYSGKTFLVIKAGGNSGVYFIETSATVQTN